MTVAQYESVATTKFNKKAFTAKCKKAISKFINNNLVFFQYPTGMCVDPNQQQIWH
jgi:hypothetical protein